MAQKLQSWLKVPHAPLQANRRVFFGQLLVETRCPPIGFAKEVVNALLTQSEVKGVPIINYQPSGPAFVTRMDDNEYVLVLEGNVADYLRISLEDTRTLYVSFREATLKDRAPVVQSQLGFAPTYVLTLSIVASQPGELDENGFWEQLANILSRGLRNPGLDGRPPDPNVKLAHAYGNDLQPPFDLE